MDITKLKLITLLFSLVLNVSATDTVSLEVKLIDFEQRCFSVATSEQERLCDELAAELEGNVDEKLVSPCQDHTDDHINGSLLNLDQYINAATSKMSCTEDDKELAQKGWQEEIGCNIGRSVKRVAQHLLPSILNRDKSVGDQSSEGSSCFDTGRSDCLTELYSLTMQNIMGTFKSLGDVANLVSNGVSAGISSLKDWITGKEDSLVSLAGTTESEVRSFWRNPIEWLKDMLVKLTGATDRWLRKSVLCQKWSGEPHAPESECIEELESLWCMKANDKLNLMCAGIGFAISEIGISLATIGTLRVATHGVSLTKVVSKQQATAAKAKLLEKFPNLARASSKSDEAKLAVGSAKSGKVTRVSEELIESITKSVSNYRNLMKRTKLQKIASSRAYRNSVKLAANSRQLAAKVGKPVLNTGRATISTAAKTFSGVSRGMDKVNPLRVFDTIAEKADRGILRGLSSLGETSKDLVAQSARSGKSRARTLMTGAKINRYTGKADKFANAHHPDRNHTNPSDRPDRNPPSKRPGDGSNGRTDDPSGRPDKDTTDNLNDRSDRDATDQAERDRIQAENNKRDERAKEEQRLKDEQRRKEEEEERRRAEQERLARIRAAKLRGSDVVAVDLAAKAARAVNEAEEGSAPPPISEKAVDEILSQDDNTAVEATVDSLEQRTGHNFDNQSEANRFANNMAKKFSDQEQREKIVDRYQKEMNITQAQARKVYDSEQDFYTNYVKSLEEKRASINEERSKNLNNKPSRDRYSVMSATSTSERDKRMSEVRSLRERIEANKKRLANLKANDSEAVERTVGNTSSVSRRIATSNITSDALSPHTLSPSHSGQQTNVSNSVATNSDTQLSNETTEEVKVENLKGGQVDRVSKDVDEELERQRSVRDRQESLDLLTELTLRLEDPKGISFKALDQEPLTQFVFKRHQSQMLEGTDSTHLEVYTLEVKGKKYHIFKDYIMDKAYAVRVDSSKDSHFIDSFPRDLFSE